jgi:hypothetical protein
MEAEGAAEQESQGCSPSVRGREEKGGCEQGFTCGLGRLPRPTCLPMGSGLVTVVLKKPSHSRRPYRPAQWLCLFPVCGRHQGMRVLNCLAEGSQALPASTQEQTPRRAPELLRPFFLSW